MEYHGKVESGTCLSRRQPLQSSNPSFLCWNSDSVLPDLTFEEKLVPKTGFNVTFHDFKFGNLQKMQYGPY